MADGTKAGGDAPRTLFSLGRSGKRKGRSTEASPLEDYPPRHAEESSVDTDVATIDPDEVTASDLSDGSDTPVDEIDAETTDEAAASEPCPSCSLPLVPGAMFCGECGTRVGPAEAAAPTGILLDDDVPGEPLPPDADGSFEVAEPVTGTFEDDENLDADDLVEDDGHEIEESAVFGAFIGAEGVHEAELADDGEVVAEAQPEAELVEEVAEAQPDAELVEEGVEPEAELVEEDVEPEAELVEEGVESEAELVEEDVEPEAELVEEDAEAETTDDDGTVVPIVAGVAGAAAAGAVVGGVATADAADAAPLESSSAGAAGGSGGGSKKGVWIGAAAAAAAVVLIIGVVAMGGGGKSADKKNDQVAAVSEKSTTTTAGSSTTESTATTEAPTTTADPGTTDTTTPASTATTQGQTTTTGAPQVPVVPTTPPPASKANVQVHCPPTLDAGNNYQMILENVGGTQTSFLVTWSALKTGVSVSPTSGTVGANSRTAVNVSVAPGTPGSGSRVTIKWTGGSTSCNLVVR